MKHTNPKNLVKLRANFSLVLAILLVMALMVTACAGTDEAGEVEEAPAVAVEEEPAVVEEEPVVVEEEPAVVGEEVLAPQMIDEFSFYTAQELIGDDVLNAQMQDWGKIEDVIIGVESNMADYAVLDLNEDLLEVLDDSAMTLIPLDSLSPSAEPEAFFLNEMVNAEMLQNAPVFTEDALTNIGDPAWDDNTFNYWQTEGLVEPITAETETMAVTAGPAFIRASELTGGVAPVVDTAGTDIGIIENILVSLMPDQPNYAWMSFAGLAELGDRSFAVPLNHLDFNQLAQGNVIFDADVATLEQAPMLNEEAFVAPGVVNDPVWGYSTAEFWEIQETAAVPDTEEGPAGEATVGSLAFVAANELIGDDVLNDQMQDWGKIQDVIVGVGPSTVDYGVLDLNEELLGTTEDAGWALFPLSALSPTAEAEAFSLDTRINQEMFLNAPTFTEEDLANFGDDTWDDELFSFWQNEGFIDAEVIGTEAMGTMVSPSHVRVSELMGAETSVVNSAGETTAEIQNILVGMMPNTSDYAIMTFEGFPEIGDRQIVVPVERLDFSQLVEGNINFEADVAMLEQAPAFNEEAFVEPGIITDPTWNDEFFNFWEGEDVAVVPGVETEEGVATGAAAAGFTFIKAEELIGDDVLNDQMQDWGKIQDVIIGIPAGTTDYAVLDLNEDLLSLQNDTITLIPLTSLSPSAEAEAFDLNPGINTEMLQNAPTFTDADLTNLGDNTWDDEIFGYWQTEGFIEADTIGIDEAAMAVGPSFLRLSELEGDNVSIISPAEEQVGEIEDVIISMVPNTADYGVVNFGGFLELGEEQFVVPLERMDFSRLGEGNIIFDTDQANLEDAPIFDEGLFSGATADNTWDDDLAVFWGVEDTTDVQ